MRDRVQELQLSDVASIEKLTREAQGLAKRAGLSVSDWLAGLPEEQRGKWAGVPEMLAVWEQVGREMRARQDWHERLYQARDARGMKAIFGYWFLVYAEHELRLKGIGLETEQAVSYTLDTVLGTLKDESVRERMAYELVHA